jgi:hypothetical protein
MRQSVLPLALGVLLPAILAIPPAASGAPRPVRALVLRDAASPVLGELRGQLGARLQVDRATSRPLRQSRRYRLLIVDGDALSPAELARRRRAIDRYMDRRGWVLALDVRRGHFARAIDRLTRVSVRPATGGHSARVFLFRHARVGRVPATVTLRAARLNPVGSAQLPPSPREKALADNTARIAAMLRARLLRPRTGLPPAPSVHLTSGGDGIPAEALHKLWPHTEANAGVVRPNELSLGDLSIATSGRWQTKEPLELGNGTLNFKLATPVTLADTVAPSSGSAHATSAGESSSTGCRPARPTSTTRSTPPTSCPSG